MAVPTAADQPGDLFPNQRNKGVISHCSDIVPTLCLTLLLNPPAVLVIHRNDDYGAASIDINTSLVAK